MLGFLSLLRLVEMFDHFSLIGVARRIDHYKQLKFKTDSAQSSSNKCKNYLLKIYS